MLIINPSYYHRLYTVVVHELNLRRWYFGILNLIWILIQYYYECFVYFFFNIYNKKKLSIVSHGWNRIFMSTNNCWMKRNSCKTTCISQTLPASLLFRKVISFKHDEIGLTYDRTVNTHDTICLMNDIGKDKQCSR